MADIYKYNPKAHYTPSMSSGGLRLEKYQIYINNNNQYVTLDFPNIFEDYKIVREKDKWAISNTLFSQLQSRPPKLYEYFHMYRCQLNFAIFCATSALGISRQHLTQGSLLLQSIYRFHVYYHICRIFKLLLAPMPLEEAYQKWNNPFDKNGYHRICHQYGVNPSHIWMSGNWMTSTQGDFVEGGKMANSFTKFSNDYSTWICDASKGLTYNALNLLSESVRNYVYLLITSQVSARHNILQSPAAKQIYLDNLRDIINRQVDTAKDIERYQNVLKYARSKVDFATAQGVYMLPSNMLLKIGDVIGYNNKLLIADNDVRIGMVNQHINIKQNVVASRAKSSHGDQTNKQHQQMQPSAGKKKLAQEHVEEKDALIIAGVMLIIAGIYFFK